MHNHGEKIELRSREAQVLFELLKNGRAADKLIAKKIGTTQPTVTRIRQKLEQAGVIERYRAVADYRKAGIGLIALTFWTWMDYSKATERHKFMDYIKVKPQVMFLSRGEGIEGRTTVMMSAHRDFTDYESFIREVRSVGGVNVGRLIQFIASPGFYKQYDSTDAMIHALTASSKMEKKNTAKEKEED